MTSTADSFRTPAATAIPDAAADGVAAGRVVLGRPPPPCPEGTEMRFASAGSHLHDRYGERYLSIGFTFDHGRVDLGGGQVMDLPEPGEGWFERSLGRVELDRFVRPPHSRCATG